ncbi:MAG TPA: transglycosylase SLT domain-containing protein [Ignavibacteriaceae bacterium]|nr:transglycosylase SLT domain-containing protein [Ignavibacteriaceae bacterium]
MIGNLELKITDPQKQIANPAEVPDHYTDAQKAKIENAAKQFESLLTSMMLKSMTKTSEGMFGDKSFGGDYFDTVFQNEIASFISKNKSMGVANVLYKKITGEDMDSKAQSSQLSPLNNGSNSDLKLNNDSIPITPSTKSTDRLSRYDDIINSASQQFGVDKNLIKSVILTESAANERAVSSEKAKGLMQLIDSTAKEMGVSNVWDPKQNILGGTKYLAQMLQKFNGNVDLALASYNAGPQNVEKYGGVPPFEETQNYIKRVMGYLNHLKGATNGTEQSI